MINKNNRSLEARTSEIDALGKAKAVLSGADYSLVQAPGPVTEDDVLWSNVTKYSLM